eukprot:4677927-Lingulodinium_polyedra.AAC.1
MAFGCLLSCLSFNTCCLSNCICDLLSFAGFCRVCCITTRVKRVWYKRGLTPPQRASELHSRK